MLAARFPLSTARRSPSRTTIVPTFVLTPAGPSRPHSLDRNATGLTLNIRARAMAGPRKKKRYSATPSRVEVNLRAIPFLPQDGWRLSTLKQFPIVGTVPKNYLSYGDPRNPRTQGYIAKKGRTSHDARECVTEEIISKIGTLLPLHIANPRLVRLSTTDVRFLSQNFLVRDRHELLHGIELFARFFETNTADVVSAFGLKNRDSE